MYSPQCAITPQQGKQLESVLPDWALPLSCVDGLRGVFDVAVPGTTTPTAFGGKFGVSGLHDEYNHTVSLFIYPQWVPTTIKEVQPQDMPVEVTSPIPSPEPSPIVAEEKDADNDVPTPFPTSNCGSTDVQNISISMMDTSA